MLRNAAPLLARLAQALADPKAELFVVDLKPIPLAQGHRIHTHALPGAAVGRGFSGFPFSLAAVMDEGGCLVRWSIFPGNAWEIWARALVAGLPNVLRDRGCNLPTRCSPEPHPLVPVKEWLLAREEGLQ